MWSLCLTTPLSLLHLYYIIYGVESQGKIKCKCFLKTVSLCVLLYSCIHSVIMYESNCESLFSLDTHIVLCLSRKIFIRFYCIIV